MINSVAEFDTGQLSMISLDSTTDIPVSVWLGDLRWHAEMECANVLQSKAIIPGGTTTSCHSPRSDSLDSGLCVAVSVRASIDVVERGSSNIMLEFRKVLQNLQRLRFKSIYSNVKQLTGTIRAFFRDVVVLLKRSTAPFKEKELEARQLCDQLEKLVSSSVMLNGHEASIETIYTSLRALAVAFSTVTEQATCELIETLINTIRYRSLETSIDVTLQDLFALVLKNDVMAALISKAGGIGVLVDICNDVPYKRYWPICLRTISSICCIKEAILQLESHKGLDMATSLLQDSFLSETVRSEAAAVVAQITSPWITQCNGTIASLNNNVEELIRSLTMLCLAATCHDIFLLGAAAIANITFISPSAFDYILRFNTTRVLINACQLNKAETLFAKDQVATVLANMAVYSWCHKEMMLQNGVELLLHFLSESPKNYSNSAEKAACERLQQKAAIALNRLSREAHNAQIVIECSGLERLAILCRRSDERYGSDAVLVACLATLRQIHDVVGAEDFTSADLQDLVNPKMIDSFLACSQLEESFV